MCSSPPLISRATAIPRAALNAVPATGGSAVELSTLIDASSDVSPELWRRYLGIILRGLSAHPDREPKLGIEPLGPGQVDHVMSFVKPARR